MHTALHLWMNVTPSLCEWKDLKPIVMLSKLHHMWCRSLKKKLHDKLHQELGQQDAGALPAVRAG